MFQIPNSPWPTKRGKSSASQGFFPDSSWSLLLIHLWILRWLGQTVFVSKFSSQFGLLLQGCTEEKPTKKRLPFFFFFYHCSWKRVCVKMDLSSEITGFNYLLSPSWGQAVKKGIAQRLSHTDTRLSFVCLLSVCHKGSAKDVPWAQMLLQEDVDALSYHRTRRSSWWTLGQQQDRHHSSGFCHFRSLWCMS